MKTKKNLVMTSLLILGGISKGNAQATHNTIIGPNNNTNATSNVSIGDDPNLFTNAAANWNTFVGALAGNVNSSGEQNTFIGYVSGNGNTTGSGNSALGVGSFQASSGSRNIGIGQNGSTHITGDDNIYLGNGTGNWFTGDANVFLGGGVNANGNPRTLNNTVILADGVANQRMYIDNRGCVAFGLGPFTAASNRVEINSVWNAAGIVSGTAGLRFNGFTNANFNALTGATTPKVLTVNGDGDVILVDDATGASGPDNDDWNLTGNSGTAPSLNRSTPTGDFLGTTDDKDLVFRRNNIRSGLIQDAASGKSNTAFGYDALTAAGGTLSGESNTAVGVNSLYTNTSGYNNTAFGFATLKDGNGNHNVAMGFNAMLHNTGSSNTVIGADALGQTGTTGWDVAIGRGAGAGVTGGSRSIFIGNNAGPGSGSVSNKLYIHSATGSTTTPLILGDFLTRDLTFYVSTNGSSRVNITSGASDTSGLKFQNLTSSFAPSTSATKFLTVDGTGDVILQNLPSAACTLYSCDGILLSDRTVSMDNKRLIFDTEESGRIYIGNTTSPAFNSSNFATTSGDYRLYVEGGILTEKVKVALRSTADWADYVFEKDYKLMPLHEIETFVNNNGHLPGIDSAEDLVKKGLDVAEVQAKQMGKIEELTLYAIQQNKTIEKQGKEIEELKAMVKALMEKK